MKEQTPGPEQETPQQKFLRLVELLSQEGEQMEGSLARDREFELADGRKVTASLFVKEVEGEAPAEKILAQVDVEQRVGSERVLKVYTLTADGQLKQLTISGNPKSGKEFLEHVRRTNESMRQEKEMGLDQVSEEELKEINELLEKLLEH